MTIGRYKHVNIQHNGLFFGNLLFLHRGVVEGALQIQKKEDRIIIDCLSSYNKTEYLHGEFDILELQQKTC